MNDTMTQPSEPPAVRPATPHPLFGLIIAQFLGAFNDNIYKMVLSLFAISMAAGSSDNSSYIPMIGAIFVLPYLLFSGYAGHLADVQSKRRVLIATKLLEIGAMALGCLAFFTTDMGLMLAVLFLMSLQSALFSPAKYGIIPEIVPSTALSRVNGVIEMTTFLAIILGTTIGSVLFTTWQSHLVRIGLVLIGIATLGTLASLLIPRVPPAIASGVGKPFPRNPWGEIIQGTRRLLSDRPLWLISLGIAYFWFLGALLQMDLLLYGKHVLGATDVEVGLLQTFIAVGIGAGSLAAGCLSGHKVELGLVPLGGLGIGLSALALALMPPRFSMAAGLLIALGMAGGLLIVPLNSFVQHRSGHGEKGRLVATINFMSTLGVLLASGVLWICQTLGLSADRILLIFGLATLAGTVCVVRLLPTFLVRFCLWLLTHTLYRIRIVGQPHIPQRGPALLICNHVSFVDGFLVGACVQRFVRFIVYRGFYEHPPLNWLFRAMHAIPIAGGDPEGVAASLEHARRELIDGHVVCIFAEGAISRTGNMLPFKRGFERMVADLDVPIIPVHLDRVWGSMFSFKDGRFLRKWPRQLPYPVTVSFGAPIPASTTAFEARQAIMELGAAAAAYRHSRRDTLPRRFIRTAKQNWSRFCMADANGSPYTFGQVLTQSINLAGWLRHRQPQEAIIGLVSPPSVDSAIANIAVLLAGKIPVHLDATADDDAWRAVVDQCQMRTILTTHDILLDASHSQRRDQLGVQWVVIKDAMADASPGHPGIKRAITRLLPTWLLRARYTKRDQHHTSLATICFTTAGVATPQGAMLSHHNVLANLENLDQVFLLSPRDCLLGTLPLHHAFGWTLTLWFPVIGGYGVVYHADPMAADTVGDLVRRHQATLLLSTPTYCQSYVQQTPDEDFASLRYAVVGSEPLSAALADAFQAKFGTELLEGYGCNEMAPVIAVNIPDVVYESHHQVGRVPGSVGHPLPGVAAKIVCPVTGEPLDEGEEGLLLVKGPNQMAGYWRAPELTAKAIRDGWYVTGDRAVIDERGFIRIASRQA